MDLTTLPAAAIATLTIIGTKASEKIGQGLGDKILEQVGKLELLLLNKFPKTLKTIEAVEGKPESLGEAIQEVEAVAKSDQWVAEAVEAVATAVKAEPQGVKNLTNNIVKKGLNAPGGTFTGNIIFNN